MSFRRTRARNKLLSSMFSWIRYSSEWRTRSFSLLSFSLDLCIRIMWHSNSVHSCVQQKCGLKMKSGCPRLKSPQQRTPTHTQASLYLNRPQSSVPQPENKMQLIHLSKWYKSMNENSWQGMQNWFVESVLTFCNVCRDAQYIGIILVISRYYIFFYITYWIFNYKCRFQPFFIPYMIVATTKFTNFNIS